MVTMIQFDTTTTRQKKVNLTPLIDMVFLLVVFFMLSSHFVQTELMQMHVSAVDDGSSRGNDKVISVRIRDDSRVSINGEGFTFREFKRTMARIVASHPERTIIVKADKATTVQGLVTIMDYIYGSGGRNVTLSP